MHPSMQYYLLPSRGKEPDVREDDIQGSSQTLDSDLNFQSPTCAFPSTLMQCPQKHPCNALH